MIPTTTITMADAFHKHLDECVQCEQNPFNLCPIGCLLIQSCGLALTTHKNKKDSNES